MRIPSTQLGIILLGFFVISAVFGMVKSDLTADSAGALDSNDTVSTKKLNAATPSSAKKITSHETKARKNSVASLRATSTETDFTPAQLIFANNLLRNVLKIIPRGGCVEIVRAEFLREDLRHFLPTADHLNMPATKRQHLTFVANHQNSRESLEIEAGKNTPATALSIAVEYILGKHSSRQQKIASRGRHLSRNPPQLSWVRQLVQTAKNLLKPSVSGTNAAKETSQTPLATVKNSSPNSAQATPEQAAAKIQPSPEQNSHLGESAKPAPSAPASPVSPPASIAGKSLEPLSPAEVDSAVANEVASEYESEDAVGKTKNSGNLVRAIRPGRRLRARSVARVVPSKNNTASDLSAATIVKKVTRQVKLVPLSRHNGFAVPKRTPNHAPESHPAPVRRQPVYVGDILRIEILTDGLYRLDFDDLIQRGFDPHKRFILLHAGKLQPLWKVKATNSVGYDFAFYGAAYASLFSKTNVYWLRQLTAKPLPMREQLSGNNNNTAASGTTYIAVSRFEEDRRYTANLPRSTGDEDHWFCSQWVFRTGSASFTLACDEPLSGRTATVQVMARSYSPATPSAHVKISVNGTDVGEFTWADARRNLLTATIPANVLVAGTNTVVVKGFGDTGAALEAVFFDWVEIHYARPLKANAGQLLFTSNGGDALVTNLLTTEVIAARITSQYSQRLTNISVQGSAGATKVSLKTRRSGRYAVSDVTALKIPAKLAAMDAPVALTSTDYLVITTDDLQAAGDLFAGFHAASGLRTRVLTLTQVLDAGNFGIYDPVALRRVIRKIHPEYVLLIGDMTFDYFGVYTNAVQSSLPTEFIVVNDFHAVSDFSYAAARGRDRLIAVGRIPARTYAEALVVYNKMYARMAETPTLYSLVAAADDKHPKFKVNAEAAATIVGGNIMRAYSGKIGSAQARTNLLAGWAAGTRTVYYAGHGSPTAWASPALFKASDVAALPSQDAPPLVIQLNCLSSGVQLMIKSLAETLLFTDRKGASAVVGSAGFTPPEGQMLLGEGILNGIKNGKTNGQAYRDALQVVANAKGFLPVAKSFLFLGDPAGR